MDFINVMYVFMIKERRIQNRIKGEDQMKKMAAVCCFVIACASFYGFAVIDDAARGGVDINVITSSLTLEQIQGGQGTCSMTFCIGPNTCGGLRCSVAKSCKTVLGQPSVCVQSHPPCNFGVSPPIAGCGIGCN